MKTIYPRTALHRAAKFGHPDVVLLLLKAGADVNGGGQPGVKTPLELARQNGHDDVEAKSTWQAEERRECSGVGWSFKEVSSKTMRAVGLPGAPCGIPACAFCAPSTACTGSASSCSGTSHSLPRPDDHHPVLVVHDAADAVAVLVWQHGQIGMPRRSTRIVLGMGFQHPIIMPWNVTVEILTWIFLTVAYLSDEIPIIKEDEHLPDGMRPRHCGGE